MKLPTTADGESATTDDAFLGGALRILQPARGYRAGIDAVLLAATVCARDEGPLRVLDAGAGAGVVGLCIARRLPSARVTLLEREPEMAELAHRNVARNGLEGRVDVVEADVAEPVFKAARNLASAGAFDHVLANPPFGTEGRGSTPPNELKARAQAMPGDGLDHWARFLAGVAAPAGRVTLVHKASALADICAAFANRFGGLIVFPIFPREGAPAVRVLVRGIKGSRAPLSLRQGLVLHGEGHRFLAEADAILRAGAALSLERPG